MPSTGHILDNLALIADGWRWLAIVWHVVAGVLVLLIVARRVSGRALALTLASMIASVSALAWWSGNWFNGVVFAVLTSALAWQSRHLPRYQVCAVSRRGLPIGLAALAFGWVYPHFLENATWLTYAYAAPMGLIPCPSLAAVIGVSLMANLLDSPRWGLTIGVAGLAYGLVGVARLGVWIDGWLMAAAAASIAASLRMRRVATSDAVLPAPGIFREEGERPQAAPVADAETGRNHGGRHGTAVAPVRYECDPVKDTNHDT